MLFERTLAMRVFFSDLDGTLLNDQKEITPRTKQAIDAFVAAGNCFVISTGRPLPSAIEVQEHLGLKYPGSYICAYNGAILYDSTEDRILYETGIAHDLVQPILDLADTWHVHIHAYRDRYIISRKYTEELEFYLKHIHMPVIINEDILSELPGDTWKLLAIDLHDHEQLQGFHDALLEQLGDYVRPVFSGPHYVDIFPVNAGKGQSLIQLCRLLQVPVENSLAAGDEENDLPMLEAAGCGICMCNGKEELKKIADVITREDNNHDGLLPFLQ